MNNLYTKSILSSIVAALLIIGTYTYLCRKEQCARCKNSTRPHVRIAFLSPAIHPSLEKIEHAYAATLRDNTHSYYDITIFNGGGDAQRTGVLANSIVNRNFDAICTVGASTTLLVKNLLAKRKENTPHIFLAVADPESLGIQEGTSETTGIVEKNDIATTLTMASKLIPDAKKLLLVYCPTSSSNMEKDRQTIITLLNRDGRTLETVEVFSSSEIPSKTTHAIQQADMVMILKDNVVVSGFDGLIKICNTFNRPLIASDLDSVDRGALFAVGVHEEQFGIEGAKITKKIFEDAISARQIPFAPAGAYVLKLDQLTCTRYRINSQSLKGIPSVTIEIV